jgi:hypothetical protein
VPDDYPASPRPKQRGRYLRTYWCEAGTGCRVGSYSQFFPMRRPDDFPGALLSFSSAVSRGFSKRRTSTGAPAGLRGTGPPRPSQHLPGAAHLQVGIFTPIQHRRGNGLTVWCAASGLNFKWVEKLFEVTINPKTIASRATRISSNEENKSQPTETITNLTNSLLVIGGLPNYYKAIPARLRPLKNSALSKFPLQTLQPLLDRSFPPRFKGVCVRLP